MISKLENLISRAYPLKYDYFRGTVNSHLCRKSFKLGNSRSFKRAKDYYSLKRSTFVLFFVLGFFWFYLILYGHQMQLVKLGMTVICEMLTNRFIYSFNYLFSRLNPFLANFPILYPLKTSENQRFSGVFRECRM